MSLKRLPPDDEAQNQDEIDSYYLNFKGPSASERREEAAGKFMAVLKAFTASAESGDDNPYPNLMNEMMDAGFLQQTDHQKWEMPQSSRSQAFKQFTAEDWQKLSKGLTSPMAFLNGLEDVVETDFPLSPKAKQFFGVEK